MNKAIGALTVVVVATALYWLCGNAHIDIFPCKRATVSRHQFGSSLQTSSSTCSLFAHNRGTQADGSYQRLTGAGWATLFAFCGGIGLVVGGAVGFATRRVGARPPG